LIWAKIGKQKLLLVDGMRPDANHTTYSINCTTLIFRNGQEKKIRPGSPGSNKKSQKRHDHHRRLVSRRSHGLCQLLQLVLRTPPRHGQTGKKWKDRKLAEMPNQTEN
jgi:hypothetical protein